MFSNTPISFPHSVPLTSPTTSIKSDENLEKDKKKQEPVKVFKIPKQALIKKVAVISDNIS